MKKYCSRCGREIDCTHNERCFCHPLALNGATKEALKTHYSDCLCAECLSVIKARHTNTLVLDMGGVLVNHNLDAAIVLFEQLLGKTFMEQALGLPYTIENENALIYRFENGSINTKEFLDTIKGYAHDYNPTRTVTDDDIITAWNTLHAGIDSYKFDFLRQMKQRGKKLYLLSNINAIHWEHVVKEYHLDQYFDYCCLSYECKLSKPHIEIARYLTEQVYLDASETTFIDDLEVNRQMGWQMGWGTFASIDDYIRAM